MPALVSLLDSDGKYLWVSGTVPGVDPSEVPGTYFWDWGERPQMRRRIWRRVMAGEVVRWRMRLTVGQKRWRFTATTHPIHREHSIPCSVAACDIVLPVRHALCKLSPPESKLLYAVASGHPVAKIAEKVKRPVNSVTRAVSRIREKLNAHDKITLYEEARRWFRAED